MSTISDNAMHVWVNGEDITQARLEQNRKVLQTAINDNQSQISAMYTNPEIDQKVNNAVSTKVTATGTTLPTGLQVDGAEFVLIKGNERILYVYNATLSEWEVGSYIGQSSPVPITLNHGQNIINAVQNALLNMGFTGRTLINLLGRDGNCEDVSKWSTWQATASLDSSNKVYGSNSILVTTNASNSNCSLFRNQQSLKGGKFYIALSDVKRGTAPNGIYISASANQGSASTNWTDSSKFGTVWCKVNPTSDTLTNFDIGTSATATGQTYNVDGVRVYEITQAEYNALDTMTIDQIATKYPYVDDVKHYTNPYIIGYGKNLLPPFSQWTQNGGNITIEDTYNVSYTATANYQGLYVDVPCVSNQQYTLSSTFSGNGAFCDVQYYDSNGNNLGETDLNTSGGSATFTTPTNAVKIRAIVTNNNTGNTYSFSNPMLVLGDSTQLPTTFVPQNNDNLFLQTSLCANLDGSVQDKVYQRDGQWYKGQKFVNQVLDGSLGWTFHADYTGFKSVSIPVSNLSTATYSANAVKYDGKILKIGAAGSASDVFDYTSTANTVYIEIADTDSGWGETYTPTAQEIQAYFYGWAMSATNTTPSPYTGTGTKYWYKVGTSPTTNGYYTTTCPVVLVDNLYTPYRLQYQLANPVEVAITAEGSLNVNEGLNQIELGEAVIVRESVTLAANGATYETNYPAFVANTAFKYRTQKILTFFKNGVIDEKWNVITASDAYGSQRAQLKAADYDPTATYSVTYLALPYQLACSALPQSGTYDANLKTAVDDTIQRVTDLESEVTALQITKANRQQGQWLAPTLLNGWTNYGGTFNNVGFYKDEFGIVHLRGVIKSGTLLSPVLDMPTGYKVLSTSLFSTISFDGTTRYATHVELSPSGGLVVQNGGTTWVSLDNISYRAEQ